MAAIFHGPVIGLNEVRQLLNYEVFVELGSVRVIAVETVVPFGMHHDDLGNLAGQNHLLHFILKVSVAVHRPARVIVVEAVEEIDDGVRF